MTSDDSVSAAETAILTLVMQRGPDKSICPTDAARALAGNPPDDSWRRSLAPIRQAAKRLAAAGRIEILHKGKPVTELHGVVRLRLPRPE
jgi:hypothetical protein